MVTACTGAGYWSCAIACNAWGDPFSNCLCPDNQYQSQLTLCTLDKFGSDGYTIKVLKQKLWVDGVEYLLQEIYGIENKSRRHEEGEGERGGEERGDSDDDDDEEDLGAECVICITDPRDTILLPCRHLCLCSSCGESVAITSCEACTLSAFHCTL